MAAIFRNLVLAFLCSAFALAGAASARAEEARFALVVGNDGYKDAPLATSANDAGLVAETLRAARFDVTGARDLDGDALRRWPSPPSRFMRGLPPTWSRRRPCRSSRSPS